MQSCANKIKNSSEFLFFQTVEFKEKSQLNCQGSFETIVKKVFQYILSQSYKENNVKQFFEDLKSKNYNTFVPDDKKVSIILSNYYRCIKKVSLYQQNIATFVTFKLLNTLLKKNLCNNDSHQRFPQNHFKVDLRTQKILKFDFVLRNDKLSKQNLMSLYNEKELIISLYYQQNNYYLTFQDKNNQDQNTKRYKLEFENQNLVRFCIEFTQNSLSVQNFTKNNIDLSQIQYTHANFFEGSSDVLIEFQQNGKNMIQQIELKRQNTIFLPNIIKHFQCVNFIYNISNYQLKQKDEQFQLSHKSFKYQLRILLHQANEGIKKQKQILKLIYCMFYLYAEDMYYCDILDEKNCSLFKNLIYVLIQQQDQKQISKISKFLLQNICMFKDLQTLKYFQTIIQKNSKQESFSFSKTVVYSLHQYHMKQQRTLKYHEYICKFLFDSITYKYFHQFLFTLQKLIYEIDCQSCKFEFLQKLGNFLKKSITQNGIHNKLNRFLLDNIQQYQNYFDFNTLIKFYQFIILYSNNTDAKQDTIYIQEYQFLIEGGYKFQQIQSRNKLQVSLQNVDNKENLKQQLKLDIDKINNQFTFGGEQGIKKQSQFKKKRVISQLDKKNV